MRALTTVCAVLLAPLSAQTTWLVNASGGAGVHFTDLAAAVAAAADGDTIRCQHPLFGESLNGFTTNKGLTIVGDGNGVPLTTLVAPIQVVGLPVGRTFRLAGFQTVLDGELRIVLQNCQGHVEIDNVVAREPDFGFPTTPAIDIVGCTSVVLREVVDFGTPAARIDTSRVVLSGCWLGMTRIDVGGGPCLWVNNAEVDVVQPRFRTGGLQQAPGVGWAAITATNSVLRVAGQGVAVVSGGPPASATGGSAIVANGGSVTVAPTVALLAGVGQPPTAGNATFATAAVPATWSTTAQAGNLVTFFTMAQAGAAVWLALGPSAPLVATPLGSLGIDAAAGYVMLPLQTASGVVPVLGLVPVPATLPRGQGFAAQAVVWDGAALRLAAPVAFVVQ